MSIKLKTRGKYFKFANLESIFMNDMKKLLYPLAPNWWFVLKCPLTTFCSQGLTFSDLEFRVPKRFATVYG